MLSSGPYFGVFLVALMSSSLADKLLARPGASKPKIRKVLYAIANLGPALALGTMGYLTDNYFACILVMSLGKEKNQIRHTKILYLIIYHILKTKITIRVPT